MEKEEIANRFGKFLDKACYNELLTAARDGKQSLAIDFKQLDKFDPDLSDTLLHEPEDTLKIFDEAMKQVDMPYPAKLHVRFHSLPEFSEVRIRNLRAEHIGQFITVEGIVKRASEVRPQVSRTVWKCPQCNTTTEMKQTEQIMKKPLFCNCGYRGKFELVDRDLIDTRWIMAEEPFEITEGEKPSQLNIFLKDDLTTPKMQTKTDPGNRLRITGVMKEVPRQAVKGKKSVQMDIMLDANHVESTEIGYEELNITPEDEKEILDMANDPNIHEKIVDSIATSTYGLREIKEAIALQLFSGVPRLMPDGTRIRGDIHVLIVGDPATGKSQILKLVSRLAHRGRYVSGKGVTGVGLTASVTKDEQLMGGWVLEAGAVVLSNKGVCAIDEFEKINKEDLIALHEAMEQQTVSIAKAAIIATLPAQTSILAGANPKFGRFDEYKSIADQIEIPETLLSRFDLKFALKDIPNAETDTKIAEHILNSREGREKAAKPAIPPEMLRKYVAYARKNCKPILTSETGNILKKFYIDTRNKTVRGGPIPITARQYEAMMRLSEASAKIRLDSATRPDDAERAIKLLQFSLQQLGYDQETGKIDIDKAEGGMPTSQRNKQRIILDIVDLFAKETGSEIHVQDVIAEAEQEGIKNAEEIIYKLKEQGFLMEPRPGYLKKA